MGAFPARGLDVQGGGAVADSEVPDPEYERLKAQLRTMPVIEQAKGIVMAREGCGPEEAFDVLRRTSQQANVKVHVLASFLVEQIAQKAVGMSPGTEPSGEVGEVVAGLLDLGPALTVHQAARSPGPVPRARGPV